MQNANHNRVRLIHLRLCLWSRGLTLNRLPAAMALAALSLASPLILPTLAQSDTYATQVLSNHPWGYWRLNETGDPSGGTTVAVDSSTNHLDGTYGPNILNAFSAVQGPRPPAFPGFMANNAAVQGAISDANSYVAVPVGNVGTNAVTFTAWLYPSGPQGNWTGILMSRGGPVEGGIGYNDKSMLAYTWNNNSTWSYNSGLAIPQDQWSFVAVTIEPTKATMYLDYVDAATGKTNYLSSANATAQQVQGFGTNLWRIAQDFTDGSRNFVGSIDEVAVFMRTLSSSEITGLFAAGLGKLAVLPAISQAPVAKTIYAGRTVHFTAGVSGTPAPTLQWQFKAASSSSFSDLVNGATVSGATNATLVLSQVTADGAGEYRVVATNPAGSATSAAAALTVLPSPTLGNYANAVYTNGPVVYWRFSEAKTQTNAVDLMGDWMGGYEAAAAWGSSISGPSSPALPGFESNNTAVQTTGDGSTPSWLSVPTPSLSTNVGTFIAWINPSVEPEPDYAGIFLVARDWTPPGLSFTTAGQLGYHWNLDGTLTFESGLVPPANQWSMVALVVEPTMATLYLGTGGVLTNVVNRVAHNVESGWGLDAQIGCDYGNTARLFQGAIDEVAMFDKALTFDQVNTLYGTAIGKVAAALPHFVNQPVSTTRYAGFPAAFKALVTGSEPLTYQWFKGTTAVADGGNISGAKSDTLAFSKVTAADAGQYTLVATNPAGSNTSSVATLNIQALGTGAYEEAVLSANPIAYWRLNENGDPSSSTVLAHDYVGGYDGTYGATALDGFTAVAGPRPSDSFSIFEASNTALQSTASLDQSWVSGPQPALNSNTATFAMWVYPDGDQTAWAGLFMNRSGDGEGVGYNDQGMLAYTWNNNTTWSYVSGLTIPQYQWSFVAVSVEPSRAVLYLGNSKGLQTATNAVAQSVEAWGGTADIGSDNGTARVFNGKVDEVAMFNYAMSPQQVQNLFTGVSVQQPPTASIAKAAGNNLTIQWEGTGTLQSTTALKSTGTVWSDVGATSPYTVTPAGSVQYYRVKVP